MILEIIATIHVPNLIFLHRAESLRVSFCCPCWNGVARPLNDQKDESHRPGT